MIWIDRAARDSYILQGGFASLTFLLEPARS